MNRPHQAADSEMNAMTRTIVRITIAARQSVRVTLLFFFLALGASAQVTRTLTEGQTPPGIAPGAPAGSYALSGFDTVNPFNGNLNFRLPLLRVGGRGEASYTIMSPIEQHWRVDREYPCVPDPSTCPNAPTENPIPTWWNVAVAYSPGYLTGRSATDFV